MVLAYEYKFIDELNYGLLKSVWRRKKEQRHIFYRNMEN